MAINPDTDFIFDDDPTSDLPVLTTRSDGTRAAPEEQRPGGLGQLQAGQLALAQELVKLESRQKERVSELQAQLHTNNKELSVLKRRVAAIAAVSPTGRRSQPTPLPVRLLIRFNGEKEIRYPIETDTFAIGRAPDNHLQVSSHSVSRHHARITADGNDTYIEDLNSTNGLYINAERITKKLLNDGDAISVGSTTFNFSLEAQPQGS